MYNDPNNMNNYPNNGVNPNQPMQPQMQVPNQMQPQMPNQMQTQMQPQMQPQMPNQMQPQVPMNNIITNKPKKGPIIPIIMGILVLGIIAYVVFTYRDTLFKTQSEQPSTKNKTATEIVKSKETTTTKEEDTTTEKMKTEEASDKKEEISNIDNSTPQANDNTTSLIEMIPGTKLYLYQDGGIGINDVFFRHISGTTSPIEVDVIFEENEASKQRYTINLGEEVSINGIKNPIVITPEEDYFVIDFK